MDRIPEDNQANMNPEDVLAPLAGDPYHPENHPIVLVDSSEEEDPEEDPEEEPFEGEDEPVEVPESDDEDILAEIPLDGDHPKDNLTDEEIPPSPKRPYYPSYHGNGKRPMQRRTARMSVLPMAQTNMYSFVDLHICGQKRKATDYPPKSEIGESSQAPSRADEISRHVRNLEQRVEQLEDEVKTNIKAIQLLFHRSNASRSDAMHQSLRIGNLDYEGDMIRIRQDAAEHRAAVAEDESRRTREKLEELSRFVASHFK